MTKVQKSLARTGALVALAAAAGLSIFLGEKHEETETKAKETEAKAFELDKAKVKKLTLIAKGATTELEKDGDGWKITSPVQARGDKAPVDAIVDKLADLKSREVASEDPAKAADYGLDQPQYEVKAVLDDGKTLELKVGVENTFDQSLYYTRSDDKRIHIADGGLKYPLDKTLFDLRDKAIVTQEDKDVQALEVTAPGGSWTVERDGEGFKLTAPVADKADLGTVSGVLSKLRTTRAKLFAAENAAPVTLAELAAAKAPAPVKGKAPKGKPAAPALPENVAALATWGLDKPVVTAVLSIGPDKARKTLLLGQTDEAGTKKTWGHLAEGGPVWEVEESLVADLGKTLADLQDKTMLAFDREKVTKVEIGGEGGPLVVTRTKEKGVDGGSDEEKFAVEGVSDKLKTWKLTSLLYTLSTLKGAAITEDAPKDLAKYGLDKPKHSWTVFGEGGAQVGRLFVGNETGTRYWAKTDANRVYELEKATVDDLAKKKDDVVEPPPPPPAPAAPTDGGTPAAPTPANGG